MDFAHFLKFFIFVPLQVRLISYIVGVFFITTENSFIEKF